MSDRPDIAALCKNPAAALSVPTKGLALALMLEAAEAETRARLLRELLTARLTMLEGRASQEAPTDASENRKCLSVAQVRQRYGYGDRTVRRKMHDGTWQEGVHWFRKPRSRPMFYREALDAWDRERQQRPHDSGLAFGPDIPAGRRRRRAGAGGS